MGVPSTPPKDKLEEDRSPEDQFKDEVSPSNQVPPMRGLKTPNLNYSWSEAPRFPSQPLVTGATGGEEVNPRARSLEGMSSSP